MSGKTPSRYSVLSCHQTICLYKAVKITTGCRQRIAVRAVLGVTWICILACINNPGATTAVLVFATERKNNVDPRLPSQKKVNNVQLFLPSNWCTSDVSNIYE